MAVGCSERICGIEVGQHVFVFYAENALQNLRHLLLACSAIPGDGHFDFQRGVFMDWEAFADGCGYGNALCTPQFQHALHVFAKEGRFYGKFIGPEGLDDFAHALVYPAQLHIDVLAMAEVDDAHGEHFGFRSVCFQHAIAQDVCAGVNSEDGSCLLQWHVLCV